MTARIYNFEKWRKKLRQPVVGTGSCAHCGEIKYLYRVYKHDYKIRFCSLECALGFKEDCGMSDDKHLTLEQVKGMQTAVYSSSFDLLDWDEFFDAIEIPEDERW